MVRKHREEREEKDRERTARLEKARSKKEAYLLKRSKDNMDMDNKAREEEHWTMMRWLNSYIEENKYHWERRKEILQRQRESTEKEDIRKELQSERGTVEDKTNAKELRKEKALARNRGWKEWRDDSEHDDGDDDLEGGPEEGEGVKISPRKIMRGEGGKNENLELRNPIPEDTSEGTLERERIVMLREDMMKRKRWREEKEFKMERESEGEEEGANCDHIKWSVGTSGEQLCQQTNHFSGEEEEGQEEEDQLGGLLDGGGFCLECVMVPCVCILVRLETRVSMMEELDMILDKVTRTMTPLPPTQHLPILDDGESVGQVVQHPLHPPQHEILRGLCDGEGVDQVVQHPLHPPQHEILRGLCDGESVDQVLQHPLQPPHGAGSVGASQQAPGPQQVVQHLPHPILDDILPGQGDSARVRQVAQHLLHPPQHDQHLLILDDVLRGLCDGESVDQVVQHPLHPPQHEILRGLCDGESVDQVLQHPLQPPHGAGSVGASQQAPDPQPSLCEEHGDAEGEGDDQQQGEVAKQENVGIILKQITKQIPPTPPSPNSKNKSAAYKKSNIV